MLKYYFRMLITIQNRGWMVLSALAQHVKKMWSWMSLNMFKLEYGKENQEDQKYDRK